MNQRTSKLLRKYSAEVSSKQTSYKNIKKEYNRLSKTSIRKEYKDNIRELIK